MSVLSRWGRVAMTTAIAAVASVSIAAPSNAIIAGSLAASGEFPFMVSVQRTDFAGTPVNKHSCGGSLIDRSWVLTAAHCVKQNGVVLNTSQLSLIIGRTKLTSASGQIRSVAQIIPHPQFVEKNQAVFGLPARDVALLRLSTPSTMPVLRLGQPSYRDLWEPGDNTIAIGWGATSLGNPAVDDLRKVNLAVILDSVTAQPNVWGTAFERSNMVSAGSLAFNGPGICKGDSGGPLFISTQLGFRQVGVSSAGGCGAPDLPSVFARVGEGPLNQWVYQQISKLPNEGFISRAGDFNGDNRDDIITFTRHGTCDAYVALSNGSSFVPNPGTKWHDFFTCGEEVPLIGDFNGDNRDDIVVFTRGSLCDAYVALSTGSSFVPTPGIKWHDLFTCGTEIPVVGDFNGDNRDDVALFNRGITGDVLVSLSNGVQFGPATTLWHGAMGFGTEIPAVGDFNGDNRDDIVIFNRGNCCAAGTGDAIVALSTGSQFGPATTLWHDQFDFGSEIPAIGDFNADGRDDIVTFNRGNDCDVFVALSTGSTFLGSGWVWHSNFNCLASVPGVGDFNGDGRDDLVSYTRDVDGDVFVTLSNSLNAFGPAVTKWHDQFAFYGEVPGGASLW